METVDLGLTPEQLNDAFPFHIALNGDRRIIQLGRVLKRMLPSVELGDDFSRHFRINRPLTDLDSESIAAQRHSLFILEIAGEIGGEIPRQKLELRGQVVYNADTKTLLFLVAPWIRDIAMLAEHSLQINDFAIQDPVMDYLFALQSARTALKDAGRLNEKLISQRTELRNVNRELAMQYAITKLMAEADSPDDAIERILSITCQETKWDASALWLFDPEKEQLVCHSHWISPEFSFPECETFFYGFTFPHGLGLPGRVYASGESAWIPELSADENFPRAPVAKRAGLRSGFGFPVRSGKSMLGIIELFCRENRQLEDQMIAMMSGIGIKMGHFILRSRAEEALRSAHRELATRNHELQVEIGERAQIERQLEQARDAAMESARLKSEFLANMSHEIRTPMNGIIGFTNLLLGASLPAKEHEYVTDIQNSANDLLRIINDILDFSKIEAGKLEFEIIDIDLRALLESTMQMFAEPAQAKGLGLTLRIPEEDDSLRGDPVRIRQILINFLSNALKFTHSGSISVDLEILNRTETDVEIRIEVKDTGIGIPEAAQARLFQAFTQADGSTTRNYGGTGLGLSICKKLVEMMKGTIGFESETGVGSTFFFTARLARKLDAIDAPAMAPQRHADIPARARDLSDPIRILLVEDSLINQKVAIGILDRYGFLVHAVNNGEEAVQVMSREEFDIVLMDCQMPVMDGYRATREIRSMEGSRRHTPIVAMTAHAMAGDREKCLAAGMDDYLTKPIDETILLNTISRWLGGEELEEAAPAPLSSPAPAEFTPEVLDSAVINNLLMIEQESAPGFLAELVDLFVSTLPAEIESLRQAVSDRNAEKIAHLAHKLKGNSANIGVRSLAATFSRIESQGRFGLTPEIDALVEQITPQYLQGCEALKKVESGEWRVES